MGIKRVIGSGIAGMLCLIPMAWISFYFLNLTSLLTNDLIQNLPQAILDIGRSIGGPAGVFLGIALGAVIGLAMIFLFPIHWCIQYHPNNPELLIAVVVPWILCCAITSGLFAHSPRGGFNTSMAIGIGWIIAIVIPIVLLTLATGGALVGTMESLGRGFNEIGFLGAIILSILEGVGVGSVFGAFIGSLKYKPEQESGSSSKKSKSSISEPAFRDSMGPSSSFGATDDFCTNCGAKLPANDDFCTNCGAKKQ